MGQRIWEAFSSRVRPAQLPKVHLGIGLLLSQRQRSQLGRRGLATESRIRSLP